MPRQIVFTDRAPSFKAPFAQAVRTGNLVFVSGITPFTLEMTLARGDFDAQMHQTMRNLGEILKAAGSGFEQVVKCTVILANIAHWRRMNEIYAQYWPDPSDCPARTAFQAPLPNADFLVEVECVAEIGNEPPEA